MDGSYLFIGKEPEKEAIDKTEVLKEISSILSDLAQTIILINLAKN